MKQKCAVALVKGRANADVASAAHALDCSQAISVSLSTVVAPALVVAAGHSACPFAAIMDDGLRIPPSI
jgi:hypothetical protein